MAFARDLVEELLGPLRAPEARALSPAGRGVVYQIEQGLGTALGRDAAVQLAELAPEDRALFGRLGVELGDRVLYVPALLKRPAIERRLALVSAFLDSRARPAPPPPGAVSLAAAKGVDPDAYRQIGYPVFASRALRADVAERVHRALAAEKEGQGPSPGQLAGWLGCPAREVPRLVEALTAP